MRTLLEDPTARALVVFACRTLAWILAPLVLFIALVRLFDASG